MTWLSGGLQGQLWPLLLGLIEYFQPSIIISDFQSASGFPSLSSPFQNEYVGWGVLYGVRFNLPKSENSALTMEATLKTGPEVEAILQLL